MLHCLLLLRLCFPSSPLFCHLTAALQLPPASPAPAAPHVTHLLDSRLPLGRGLQPSTPLYKGVPAQPPLTIPGQPCHHTEGSCRTWWCGLEQETVKLCCTSVCLIHTCIHLCCRDLVLVGCLCYLAFYNRGQGALSIETCTTPLHTFATRQTQSAVPVHGGVCERCTGYSLMLGLVIPLSPLAGSYKVCLVGCSSSEREGGS